MYSTINYRQINCLGVSIDIHSVPYSQYLHLAGVDYARRVTPRDAT